MWPKEELGLKGPASAAAGIATVGICGIVRVGIAPDRIGEEMIQDGTVGGAASAVRTEPFSEGETAALGTQLPLPDEARHRDIRSVDCVLRWR
jgi:hypothetical protein